ncbi:hypothetical protein [Peterkaempfera sp. SMS 1(5)a]|uniref:hypothetical protein n=1 Tax=Peterkaempfera podocarpi TaxID=3232308 RepID=UPI00366CFB91
MAVVVTGSRTVADDVDKNHNRQLLVVSRAPGQAYSSAFWSSPLRRAAGAWGRDSPRRPGIGPHGARPR